MTARTPLIAGNWKMHLTVQESVELARTIRHKLDRALRAEILIAPVFTALYSVHEALGEGSRVRLGAQNVFWEDHGAFTGEVSPAHVKDAGCTHAIIGHSERRQLFGETDENVRRRVGASLGHGMTPIVCIGETLEQREAGATERVVLGQLDAALEGLSGKDLVRVVIAYEPVWAIGTGRNAKPEDAQRVHAAIRGRIAERGGSGADIRILYGGSVKPDNARELLAQEDIDGALVGGASLKADSFLAIAAAAG
jgi:triosephosphate isomerase (TIM)